MTITVTIPVLDRTSSSFKTDLDTFFTTTFPAFAAEANALASDVNEKHAGVISAANNVLPAVSAAMSAGLADAATNATTAANAAGEATAAAVIAQGVAESIKDGPVTSVDGQTGVVVLSKQNHMVNFLQGVI